MENSKDGNYLENGLIIEKGSSCTKLVCSGIWNKVNVLTDIFEIKSVCDAIKCSTEPIFLLH